MGHKYILCKYNVHVLFYIELSIALNCLVILDILFTKVLCQQINIHVLYTLRYMCRVHMSVYVICCMYVFTYCVHIIFVMQLDLLSKSPWFFTFSTIITSLLSHPIQLQWDLFIKDTLGPANMSTVERLSTFRGGKYISTIRKSIFGALESVLCREVVYMVSFIGRVL